MKNFTALLSVLIITTITASAQIPNSGFENWTTVGSYMEPQGYLTPNSYSTSTFYPVTRSTDHYPVSVGNYSIKLENNVSLLPNGDALGIVLQNNTGSMFDGPGPAFSITGHPTGLKGYYKYLPQNGDTMFISVQLYSNGTSVADGQLRTTASTSNWVPFTIPFSNYVSADSATILIAAYHADSPPPAYVPHGNSVLYIDNLSFDSLSTSISERSKNPALFNLYPMPASDIVNVSFIDQKNEAMTLRIYNMTGKIIYSEILSKNQQQINVKELNEGIYLIEITSKTELIKQKLIIQK